MERYDINSEVLSVNNVAPDNAGNVTVPLGITVGCVVPFAGSNTPDNFLFCDGAALNRTTYAALFAVIGTTYGGGDGSTTFNLPNLVNRFIQGNATVGTIKNAGLPNITGAFGGTEGGNPYCEGAFYNLGEASRKQGSSGDRDSLIYFDASRSSSIYGNSETVQPPALTMRYIIKYQ